MKYENRFIVTINFVSKILYTVRQINTGMTYTQYFVNLATPQYRKNCMSILFAEVIWLWFLKIKYKTWCHLSLDFATNASNKTKQKKNHFYSHLYISDFIILQYISAQMFLFLLKPFMKRKAIFKLWKHIHLEWNLVCFLKLETTLKTTMILILNGIFRIASLR